MKRIVITTGDPNGVGCEITSKALKRVAPARGIQFYIYRSKKTLSLDLRRFERSFKRVTVRSWVEALKVTPDTKQLIEIVSNENPAQWVEEAAMGGLCGSVDALVTAPLSKKTIAKVFPKDKGHTDILKRICPNSNPYMCFAGKDFSVVLLTDHIPLNQVEKKLSLDRVLGGIQTADKLSSLMKGKKSKLPIGLLGLNPHAGEGGLLGSFEDRVAKVAMSKFIPKGRVEGPLVSDVVFQDKLRRKYSVFVAMYHDQGLIPFKSLHDSHSSVQLTLGLPFVRTSVDHGTAEDLFGQNKANYNSMLEALSWAIKLVKING